MKKLLLLAAFVSATLIASAQTYAGDQSIVTQAGYQTNSKRALIGLQYRYTVINNIRIAPDATFFFPKDKITGLDFNLNLQYVVQLDDQLSVYPLAGLNMANNRYAGEKKRNEVRKDSEGFTDWGFNLGGGLGYKVSDNGYINLETKYIFSDTDSFVFSLGYGIKF